MATDKKGVMVYLPADVEQWLEKYCTENNITRKGKDGQQVTSMGTGIVHYLNNQLLGTTPVNQTTEGDEEMSRDDVLELVRESITPLADELAELRSEFSGLKSGNPPELVTAEDLAAIDRRLSALAHQFGTHQHRPVPVMPANRADFYRSP